MRQETPDQMTARLRRVIANADIFDYGPVRSAFKSKMWAKGPERSRPSDSGHAPGSRRSVVRAPERYAEQECEPRGRLPMPEMTRTSPPGF